MSMPTHNPGAQLGGGTLAATGMVAGVAHTLWLAVALMIIGGTLVTLAKLAPRVAIEPVRSADGRYRFGLTVNGQPRHRR